jgi:hypothetical protein
MKQQQRLYGLQKSFGSRSSVNPVAAHPTCCGNRAGIELLESFYKGPIGSVFSLGHCRQKVSYVNVT